MLWALVMLGCAEFGFPSGWSGDGFESRLEPIACSGAFVANTQHSVADDTLVIDRFWKDGPRNTIVLPVREVRAIQASTRVGQGENEVCSVVYVEMSDGHRELWADSSSTDLYGRAEGLARAIDRPLAETLSPVSTDVADAGSSADQSASPPKVP